MHDRTFLGVVVASFAEGSPAQGVGLFVAYAGGMALIVGCAAPGGSPRAAVGLLTH
ncbi:hypothetical protein [Actinoplanes sp. NPDC049265]|uniref:hypothetical protein n=1 Tax=Actinoplanes sp. NPDC049265 TaxID=3363902 RepID=UPI003710030B